MPLKTTRFTFWFSLGNHILNDIINVKIQHTVHFYWSFFLFKYKSNMAKSFTVITKPTNTKIWCGIRLGGYYERWQKQNMQRYFQFLVTFDIMLRYRPDNAKLHIQSLIKTKLYRWWEVNFKNNDLGPPASTLYTIRF